MQRVDRKILSWAMYDWANSAYATTVMAGFFPIFFKQYWSGAAELTQSSFRLGLANSIASLIIVVLAPVLGAIADRGGAKKRFLLFFALLGIVMTGAMPLVAQGEWLAAVLLYALATIGFSGSVTFYDSLIVNVADRERMDFVSALGYAAGYLGGGLLFAVNVTMTLNPAWFGLADAAAAVKISFVTTALWWAVFTVPLLLFVEEARVPGAPGVAASVRGGLRQLAATLREVRKLRVVSLFLVGYWLYIDGVDTIVRMAVDYGMALGFDSNSLIVALLITQFVGFPAAIAFGILGQRYGTKLGIYLGIGVYIAICVYASVMDSEAEFYALAIAVGLVQGGIQSLSRSFYARIIPTDKSAEFFGFYNMLGKFAAVIGPAMMGWLSLVTGSPRLSILSIILLFVLGGAVLFWVDEEEGRRMAKQLERV